jgi:hypothetical protein
VLQQIGRGDTQVPNLGSLLHMRAMGLPWLTPGAFKAPFGVTTEALPYEGSGTYMYNFGVDPSFELEATFPAEEGFVHYVVGANNNAVEQGVRFMLTGVVENPCAPNVCGVQR